MTAFNVTHNSDMNVTPFVDVMLVLLIIFMVALPAATLNMKLDIPPPARTTALQEPTIVWISSDGSLRVGDRRATLMNLPAVVSQAVGPPRKTNGPRVYLRGERGLRYGGFFAVMDRLHDSGYHEVAIVSEAL